MQVRETALAGVKLVEMPIFGDHRGFFMESYHAQKFREAGITAAFMQDNHSLSVEAGTLRGLHYQLQPQPQAKLVRVIDGAIYDVAVDIRPGSPTFGYWVGYILSAANCRQLYIPHGFAHGFCTLVPNTQVCYKVDGYYAPELDRGIAWDDPALGIDWPVNRPVLSEKDAQLPRLAEAELNF